MKLMITKFIIMVGGGALAGGILGWLMRCAGSG